MKILYLHSVPFNSQMANLIQVRSMCRAMHENGNEVILSLPESKNEQNNYHKDEEFKIDIRKNIFNSYRIDKYLNMVSIHNSVKRYNPDLIYLRTPLLLFQIRNIKIPIIYELHNNQLHQGSKFLNNYWKRLLRNKSKTESLIKIICISQKLSNYWVGQGLPKDKVVTAHDAIDKKQFEVLLEKREARDYLGLNTDNKIIAYTGRLYRNRKIETILSLAKKYPEVYFMIVGGPDKEAEKLKSISIRENINNVIITGQVPQKDIPYYLFASDILLALWSSDVKTINYCSPLKLFEYMGAGRVIVAHGFPTILEILKDEQNAIICEPDSLDDLIEKVGRSLKIQDPSIMGNRARNEVFEKYTWQKRAADILNF